MNVTQRNNKFYRTRFSNVGLGRRFSLAPGGTPLVKVSNTHFGVSAPGFGPDNVYGLLTPTGPVPYYIPTFDTITDGTIVFNPDSNPLVLGSESFPVGGQVILVDPPFFKGASSYIMEAEFDSAARTVALTWTYPDLSLMNLTEFEHSYVTRVILQRSTSTRATPFGPVGDGPVNANFNVVNYSNIPDDPEWDTIVNDLHDPGVSVDTAPPYASLRDSYTDSLPVSSSHIFHYRLLILTYTRTGTPPQPPFNENRREIDWNSATIISSYSLTVRTDTNQPRLSWSLPSASELDALSELFPGSFTAERSAILYATTQGSFEMPPGDSTTESADVAVNTNSFITAGNLDGYVMAGAGTVRLKRGTAPNTIRVVNPGYAGNAAETTIISSGKAITSTTQLRWVFDLSSGPINYTLQKSYDGTNFVTVATLSAGFTQPFKNEDPPNPTVYYKLIANMGPMGLITFNFTLPYIVDSVTA